MHVVALYLTGRDDQTCKKTDNCNLEHEHNSKDWRYTCKFEKEQHIENITIYSQKGVSENVILEYELQDGRSSGLKEKFDFIQKGTTLTLARFNAMLLYTMSYKN